MNKNNKRLFVEMLFISILIPVSIPACSDIDVDDGLISTKKIPQVCSGQSNIQVTNNYYGSSYGDPGEPSQLAHAADAELVYDGILREGNQFAIAWARRTDNNIYFRIWDANNKVFLTSELLLSNWYTVNGWVNRLGHIGDCSYSSSYNCAWFTWEDHWETVNLAWVDKYGNSGVSGQWFYGHHPSGDTGTKYLYPWGVYQWRMLLAYISSDRQQVRARLLDNNGNLIKDIFISPTDYSLTAYQTAVSYSSIEERWLITWSENDYPVHGHQNGRIYGRQVDWNGNLVSATPRYMYCEASQTPECPVSKAEKVDENQVRLDPNCFCNNIWLASSNYSSNIDRYRLHQYNKHVSIDSTGMINQFSENFDGCRSLCPMTEAYLWKNGSFISFQSLRQDISDQYDKMHIQNYLLKDNDVNTIYPDAYVTDDYTKPQTFRSRTGIAVVLSTNDFKSSQTIPGLRLSIVNTVTNGCP